MKNTLIVIAGLALAVAGFMVGRSFPAHTTTQSQAKERDGNELFQRRLRCKSEADDYAKKSSESNSGLMVEKVEFSPARHSCVASFTRITRGKLEMWSYETIDILTGEMLYSEECIENDQNNKRFCGNGRDVDIRKGRDDALAAAVVSSSQN
jgi:hypothetical protein